MHRLVFLKIFLAYAGFVSTVKIRCTASKTLFPWKRNRLEETTKMQAGDILCGRRFVYVLRPIPMLF